ncbi:MAG: hypothetical protein WAT46_05355, partial [Saprospiraceae bacterium]
KDYNGDGDYDDYDAIMWDDEANSSKGFKPWSKFNHPQLGEVEIGGFHPKFFSQNGPTWQLERWIKKQSLFNLRMAMDLPQIELKETKVSKKDSIYEVYVSWTNTGKLPVALDQAKRVKIVQEDRVVLDFEKDLLKGFDEASVIIKEPTTHDKTIFAGYAEPGQTKSAIFRVKVNKKESVKGKLKLLSTRGGYIEKEIVFD